MCVSGMAGLSVKYLKTQLATNFSIETDYHVFSEILLGAMRVCTLVLVEIFKNLQESARYYM